MYGNKDFQNKLHFLMRISLLHDGAELNIVRLVLKQTFYWLVMLVMHMFKKFVACVTEQTKDAPAGPGVALYQG